MGWLFAERDNVGWQGLACRKGRREAGSCLSSSCHQDEAGSAWGAWPIGKSSLQRGADSGFYLSAEA